MNPYLIDRSRRPVVASSGGGYWCLACRGTIVRPRHHVKMHSHKYNVVRMQLRLCGINDAQVDTLILANFGNPIPGLTSATYLNMLFAVPLRKLKLRVQQTPTESRAHP